MSLPDFASLGLPAPVLKAVSALGYEQPTPIQARSIPILLQGRNLLGTAQTGTGKTAAFALPLLGRIAPGAMGTQVLVLTPTRELAIQVAEAFQSYAAEIPDFHVLPIYGGSDMRGQLRGLKRGAQVVVGTPGRILDHLRRKSLDLGALACLVLDEADEMLRMGFIEDIETILASIPPTSQRALFSATMPERIRRVVATYLPDAERVDIESKTRTVERIAQQWLLLKNDQKMDALTRILEVEDYDAMLVFVRTKSATAEIAHKLTARGCAAAPLNGDLNQALRERTIAQLRNGEIDVVVATDVAARGLDVERISHVVNYDIPYDNESYVHRIGRTGRAGREGKAILFVTPKERNLLRAIERSTRQPITAMQLPSNRELGEQRVQQLVTRLKEQVQSEELPPFRDLVETIAAQHDLDLVDVAAALLLEHQRARPLFPAGEEPAVAQADSARDRKPAGATGEHHERPRKRRDSTGPAGVRMRTYRLEVGRADGVEPRNIVGAIANEAGIESQYIGAIVLHDAFSTVELPEGMPRDIFRHLQQVRLGGKPLRISELGGKGGAGAKGGRSPGHADSGKRPGNRKDRGVARKDGKPGPHGNGNRKGYKKADNSSRVGKRKHETRGSGRD